MRTKLMMPTLLVSGLMFSFILVIGVLGVQILSIQIQAKEDLLRVKAGHHLNESLAVLATTAQIIQRKQTLVNALDLDNQFEVIDLLDTYSDHAALSFVTVYDHNLDIFARSDIPGDFGRPDELFPILQSTIQKNQASFHVKVYEQQLSLLYVLPLQSINGMSGAMVVGRFIDDSFLYPAHGADGLQLKVKYFGGFRGGGTQLSADQGAVLKAGPNEDLNQLLLLKGINALEGVPVEFYVYFADGSDGPAIISRFLIGLLFIVVCSFVIFYFSLRSLNRFSRRITWVAENAPHLTQGEFPAPPKALKTQDELGLMVAALEETNAAINEYIDECNGTIAEQTRAHLEMDKAKREAEDLARSKSQFLANMSHEIRTPMNGVLGMLGLLLKAKLPEDQLRKVEMAQSSAESLLSVINNILDFSKADAGKLTLEALDYDIRAHLSSFAQSMALKAEQKGIELVLDVTDIECSVVRGDSGRLRQILTNLVGNAIKFTERGEVVIRAAVEEQRQGLLFSCYVSDTGVGIPRESISALFETFSQVDSSITRGYGGTGLGLAIVRQLCALMGGSVDVTSAGTGQGCCFEFSIQLARSDYSEPVQPSVSLHGVYFLIVDDNQASARALGNQLTRWGARVVEATSGAQTLKLLNEDAKNTPAHALPIVLVDMHMPDMDGEALAGFIKNDERFRQLSLIMMVPVDSKWDRDCFAEIGFHGFFLKPFSSDELCCAISMVLDSRESIPPTISNPGNEHTIEQALVLPLESPESYCGRVLLVEDNFVNQQVALHFLDEMGLQCDVVSNGLEALDALKNVNATDPYQLILMDCQMPEMDGFEATAHIRRGDAGRDFCNVPIIAMTANVLEGVREKCSEAGMNDYLPKPINFTDMNDRVRHWLP